MFRASCNGHVIFASFPLSLRCIFVGQTQSSQRGSQPEIRQLRTGLSISTRQQLEFLPSDGLLQLWRKSVKTHCIADRAEWYICNLQREARHEARDENRGFERPHPWGTVKTLILHPLHKKLTKANFLTNSKKKPYRNALHKTLEEPKGQTN